MEPFITAIVIGLVVLLIIWIGVQYNFFVRHTNQVDNAWAQIDVQLKRRYDLIPNLIETVRAYMKHEADMFERITLLRANAMQAKSIEERGRCEGMLSGALGSFKATVENYPELKADKHFLALQEELTSTENKIAFSRQNYNDQVLFYNNKVQMFPSNLIAKIFGYAKRAFFEIDATERTVPKI